LTIILAVTGFNTAGKTSDARATPNQAADLL